MRKESDKAKKAKENQTRIDTDKIVKLHAKHTLPYSTHFSRIPGFCIAATVKSKKTKKTSTQSVGERKKFLSF